MISGEIAFGVATGQRRLAEHVEGMTEQSAFGFDRAIQRFVDVTTHDELVAHDAHGLTKRRTQHRLADTTRDAGQKAARIVHIHVARPNDAPGEHQAPGGRIHEQRLTIAQMRGPIAGGDFVRDQFVRRRVIRDAQQRFRQTHQDHAFLRR